MTALRSDGTSSNEPFVARRIVGKSDAFAQFQDLGSLTGGTLCGLSVSSTSSDFCWNFGKSVQD